MKRKTENFDIFKILQLLSEKWYVCVAFAVVFALLTATYFVYIKEEQFLASSTIFVYNESSPAATPDGGAGYEDVLTAEKLAQDCQIVATSNAVLDEVRANIPNIPVSPEKITVSLVSGSRIIKLSVTDSNPRNAAEIVNNVSDILIKVATDKVKIQDMEIIDYADIPTTPVDEQIALYVSLAAVLGFIISIGILLLIAVFNKTIYTAQDITDNFDIPVLASIPEFNMVEKRLVKTNKKDSADHKE